MAGTLNLTGAELELVGEIGREGRLKEALGEIAEKYDYVLIDSPPSLGLLTLNALVAAASGVIIPVQCEYLALEGLSQLTQTIARVRSAYHPELAVRGVMPPDQLARLERIADYLREILLGGLPQ